MAAFPKNGIEFLTDGYIRAADRLLKLKPDIFEVFLNTLSVIRESPVLYRMAWLWHYILFISNAVLMEEDIEQWMGPRNLMGELSDMLHAVVIVSGLTNLQRIYRERNIPDYILQDTLSDVQITMEEYYTRYGCYGTGTYRMGWLLYHFAGRLFRLGRLQFIHKKYDSYPRMYRHRNTGKVLMLAGPGVTFRSDGQVNGTNSVFDSQNSWISEFTDEGRFIIGTPVYASGCTSRKHVILSNEEWKQVLCKGDGILDVHIARGNHMEYSQCIESYNRALHFFHTCFPEKEIKGFTCSSWILDPQLQKLLPESSNIVRFQRDYYIYPILSDEESVFEYVFSCKPDDLSELPAQSSLQRAVKEFLLNDGHLNPAEGIILAEDLSRMPGFYQVNQECSFPDVIINKG
jgi:hypothetical protein